MTGMIALNKALSHLWRCWVGPYPLHMICIWVRRIGLVKDRTQMTTFLGTLQAAAKNGEIVFYGRILSENSLPVLKKIPSAHFVDHIINVRAAMVPTYDNEQVCTLRRREKTRGLCSRDAPYCNLHVNRKVLGLVLDMWSST